MNGNQARRHKAETRQTRQHLMHKSIHKLERLRGPGFTWNNSGDNLTLPPAREAENAGLHRLDGELPRLRKPHKFATHCLGKHGPENGFAMPATSAIRPAGIPGTIRWQEGKTVEKIVDKLPLSIR